MSDLSRDILGRDRFAGSNLRMVALSLLPEQTLHGADPRDRAATARERVGHDLTSLLDGAFGGGGAHPPDGIGGLAGGREGLLHVLRAHGLRREVASWIGPGPDLPLTPGQAALVFDAADVDRHARRIGSGRETLLREIAAVLPEFLRRMTSAGRLPADLAKPQRVAREVAGVPSAGC